MGWTLRQADDETNPTLPGGVYGYYITAGRLVYWRYTGGVTYYIVFISDGGRYGMDSITEMTYNGTIIPRLNGGGTENWKFHPGTFTKQISPKVIQSMAANTFNTLQPHGYVANDPVKFHARDGVIYGGVTLNQKYYVSATGLTANAFRISVDSGGVVKTDITPGTGTLTVWKADAGFDDPIQGLPTFVPEVLTTFSGIAFVEGYLPYEMSSAEGPDAALFRVKGVGRKLMSYTNAGVESGILTDASGELTNPALVAADVAIVEAKNAPSRIGWASLYQLRQQSNVNIWHRIQNNPTLPGSGLTGRYYAGQDQYVDLRLIRQDPEINFSYTGQPPGPGVPPTYWSVRWKGYIKPRYSETFTFKINHDDGTRMWINNQLLINAPQYGITSSATIALQKDVLYPITVEFWEVTTPAYVSLKWSSASQVEEIVPVARLYPEDSQVKRYTANLAAAEPIEAGEYFERVIERCPGWDWTYINGKIEFLPPDREIVYSFIYDPLDPSIEDTIVVGDFEKKKRPLKDRKNFVLFSFRNLAVSGYKKEYAEGNRANIRQLNNSRPDNDGSTELGVMTRSLAERMAEQFMRKKADPKHGYRILGDLASGKVYKNGLVRVRYFNKDNKFVADDYCIVSSKTRKGADMDFSLVPVTLVTNSLGQKVLYTDEPVA